MHNNKAFTLIELSIVLVIIGLLAGGALVGRSLLRQSEVASIMVDGQKYMNAVKGFKEKYAAYPGDMSNATSYWGIAGGTVGTNYTTDCYASGSATSPATCNGNGDGQINPISTYQNECLRAWQHLANAGFISGSYTGTTDNIAVIGVNSPAGKINNGGFSIAFTGTRIDDPYWFDGIYGHRFNFGGNYPGGAAIAATLTGGEMQSIDSKFDDGKPALGYIRSFKNGAYGIVCSSSTTVTATYITTDNTLRCSFTIITGL